MYNFLGKNWEISLLINLCLTKIEKLAGSLTVKLCPVWPQSASPAASVFTNFRERTKDSSPRRKGITLSSSPPFRHWISGSCFRHHMQRLIYTTLVTALALDFLFIVLPHWSNGSRVDMPLHSDTLSWLRTNQS